ncbi:L,D-transpeptidase family protein [Ferrimonas pelagia]
MRIWVVLVLWLFSGFSMASSATIWFQSESSRAAAVELRAQLTVLASAQVEPRFAHLLHQIQSAQSDAQLSPLYSEAYWLVKDYWRALATQPAGQLDLSQPLALLPRTGAVSRLAQNSHQDQLLPAVLALEPKVDDYLSLRNWLMRYLYLAEEAPQLVRHANVLIKPGERSDEIVQIRQRLRQLKYLPEASADPSYDGQLLEVVRQFQREHGLSDDGVIGPQTRHWLYLNYRERARILARAMIRQTHDRAFFTDEYLLVNIPAYRAQWVSQAQPLFEARVVVGMPTRQTPTMHTQLRHVVLNPRWNVPRSILYRDLLPNIAQDGHYVENNGFEVIGADEEVLDLTPQALQALAQQGFPYRLRQRSGTGNALGRYKFYLNNSRAIYLHDTPSQGLFRHSRRAYSSGCVRVEGADEFAMALLARNQTSPEQIAAWQQIWQPKWVALSSPLPVFMVYWPAWSEAGRPQFRDDLYHMEGDIDHKMASLISVVERN